MHVAHGAAGEDGPAGAGVDRVVERHHALLQRGNGRDQLERGAGLHAVGDGPVASGFLRSGGRPVGIVGGHVRHGQHGPRAWIHGDGRAPASPRLGHTACQLLFQNRLADQVERQHQRLPVLGLDDFAAHHRLEHPAAVTLDHAPPGASLQVPIILKLQAGQSAPVGSHVAEHVRRQRSVGVPAAEAGLQDDARHLPAFDGLLLGLGQPSPEHHVARTRAPGHPLPEIRCRPSGQARQSFKERGSLCGKAFDFGIERQVVAHRVDGQRPPGPIEHLAPHGGDLHDGPHLPPPFGP